MKKLLLATSALAATAGMASAQGGGGGVTHTGTPEMGNLRGKWIVDRHPNTTNSDGTLSSYGEALPGEIGKFELHTDIDVTFAMSGQTDTGLTFGASIDLDESDGDGDEGESGAFDNRKQGGEEIFVSGAFGTLTMGDTDGALDWALQDIGIGSSLGDAHTSHLGYVGNDFADGPDDGDGQIARYDRSFGDFAFGISADIAEAGGKDILAAGAKYSFTLPGLRLGLGVGWQQRAAFDGNVGNESAVKDAFGASLDADLDSGFQIILNWVNMGDSPEKFNFSGTNFNNVAPEEFVGIGVGYEMDDWTFAANYGRITEEGPFYTGQEGYGIAVNYDLGGGAELQAGYSKSSCKTFVSATNTGGSPYEDANERCRYDESDDDNAFSLGVAMNF